MKKLIFFDIDWTLLDHRTGLIPESAVKAVHEAESKGNHCLLCSGRNPYQLRKFRNLGMDGYIFSIGAGIELGGALLQKKTIPLPRMKHLMEYCNIHQIGYSLDTMEGGWTDPLYYQWFIEGRKAANPEDSDPEASAREFGMRPFGTFDGNGVLKVNLFFRGQTDVNQLIRNLDPLLSYVPVNYTDSLNRRAGEVRLASVSKGAAVKTVMDYYGIQAADTLGFGDSLNDLEMMKACGTGIAMGNAVPELKTAADYVTSDIACDGIWNGLKHFGIVE